MAFGYEKEIVRERDAMAADLAALRTVVEALTLRCAELESVLHLIATPKRPDGTYNYCREACEQLAKEVL